MLSCRIEWLRTMWAICHSHFLSESERWGCSRQIYAWTMSKLHLIGHLFGYSNCRELSYEHISNELRFLFGTFYTLSAVISHFAEMWPEGVDDVGRAPYIHVKHVWQFSSRRNWSLFGRVFLSFKIFVNHKMYKYLLMHNTQSTPRAPFAYIVSVQLIEKPTRNSPLSR